MIDDITTKTPQQISEYYKARAEQKHRAIMRTVESIKQYKVKSNNML